jgi:hypothetical protein
VEKVLKLLHRKERWLVVAGVRFLRTCIGTKVGSPGGHDISTAACLYAALDGAADMPQVRGPMRS